jgi:large subunit ribosomal protein L6
VAKFYVTFINEGGITMSRIGKLPIQIPAGVTVTVKENEVSVKGPKGELTQPIESDAIQIKVEGNVCTLTRANDERESRAKHGLYRSLINNMVVGVSEGYKKVLELVGVGFRTSNNGQILELILGYTHNIYLELPKEVSVETKSERNQNPLILLESCDKQLLGQICAKIRSFRKAGKTAGK